MADVFGAPSSSGIINNYTQVGPLLTSGSITPPIGTKRIEAMLCGGGTLAFGGCQIYNIPVTGLMLTYTIAAAGGVTYVLSKSGIHAAVGGQYGGSGSGGAGTAQSGGPGYPPFNQANLLWSALDVAPKTGAGPGYLISTVAPYPVLQLGMGQINDGTNIIGFPCDAYLGWGGGGGSAGNLGPGNTGGSGGSGGKGGNSGAGSAGGAGGAGGSGGPSGPGTATSGGVGGSMATVSMWGLTGFAGGAGATAVNGGGGGGGGMLGAGGNASGTSTGAGGLGGGGGSPGGAGFVMFRFYY